MDKRKTDLAIIGGGVIGLCTAYYAAQTGASIVLLERDCIPGGSSYGNAGLIVPSHSSPLPTPQVLREGLHQLFVRDGAFSIRLRPDPDLFSWLWRFRGFCNRRYFEHSVEVLKSLGQESLVLHEEMARLAGGCYEYEQTGLLTLYETSEKFREGCREAEQLRALGMESRILDPDEAVSMEPGIRSKIAGGILHPQDAKLLPADFLKWLKREVEKQGVKILEDTETFDFHVRGRQVDTIFTTKGTFRADRVIIAAGAWTPLLCRKLGIRMPIQPAKGYSLTYAAPHAAPPRRPFLLGEAFIVVTPFRNMLRMTGVMELAGLNEAMDHGRIRSIRRRAGRYLPDMEGMELLEIWRGFRPCTPDDIPVIGKASCLNNLWIASGHAIRGISLGPATGKRMGRLLSGREIPHARELSPDRFS